MQTEKLYETDGTLAVFDAKVNDCRRIADGFAVILDRTAFFPGGGGQEADLGRIGGAKVVAMREAGEELLHITDSPLPVGEVVECAIDYEARLRRMQNHGGEHIVSGIVNRKYGFNNVGFHMGSDDITIDFDGVLDRAQLVEIEQLANRAVIANRNIKIAFPSPEELAALPYRSKKELEGRVRIVEIEDFDRCACCAPHLPTTGMIGIIKILDFAHHKGGIRVHLLCGLDALEDYHRRYSDEAAMSALLSAHQGEVVGAVRRLNNENGVLRGEIGELRRRLLRSLADSAPASDDCVCVFENADASGMRYFVNQCVEKCRMAAIFAGNDAEGYRYIIGSNKVDLRGLSRELNERFGGRGGGSAVMIQGQVPATEADIRSFLQSK